jgi:hypothetical protein
MRHGIDIWLRAALAVLALSAVAARAVGAAAGAVRSHYPLRSEKMSPVCLAVSPTGKWLAVGALDELSVVRVDVHDVRTGKRVAGLRGGDYVDIAWHPWKPLLAIGRQMWEGDTEYRVLNVTTGKMTPAEPGGAEPFDWLPDGKDTVGYYWGVETPGLWGERVAVEAIKIAADWTVAAEVGVADVCGIDIYHKEAKRLRYHRTATLGPDKDRSTGKVTSFCTQPAFLSSGRLGYVRVFVDDKGERERVEVWTCGKDGKDRSKWLSLPVTPRKNDPDIGRGRWYYLYRLPPVSWSRDGRIIAYVFKGDVYVKEVKPPAAK